MTEDIFRGAWRQLKGSVKREWGRLTDDDLLQINGNMDRLIGKLQQRYGYSKVQAERELDEWVRDQQGTEGSGSSFEHDFGIGPSRDYDASHDSDAHGAGGGPDEGAQYDTDTHGPGGGPDSY